MKLITKPILLDELKNLAKNGFGDMVKAVVDVNKEVMVVDAELHSDEEAYLLKNGSKQTNLWGINIYPDENKNNRIEFNSMINLKPSHGNTSLSVENKKIREKIKSIVDSLTTDEVST